MAYVIPAVDPAVIFPGARADAGRVRESERRRHGRGGAGRGVAAEGVDRHLCLALGP